MSEKMKKSPDTPSGSKSKDEKPESVQSKVNSSLEKENEILEEVTKKQDETISSLVRKIKELKKTEKK